MVWLASLRFQSPLFGGAGEGGRRGEGGKRNGGGGEWRGDKNWEKIGGRENLRA